MYAELVPIFKGKVDPLNPNSYREIKLLQFAFKLYKKLLDESLREIVHVDKMQYGFMPGKGTIKCCICSEEFCEKLKAKNKMFFIFADMEKAFDQMPREVIRFAAKWKGVPEYW